MSDEKIFAEITECPDCGQFEKTQVKDWKLGHEIWWRYTCKEADRTIAPSDGIKPPPSWCPKRKNPTG